MINISSGYKAAIYMMAFVVALVLFAAVAFGQKPGENKGGGGDRDREPRSEGTLRGLVFDEKEAAIRGAKIEVTDQEGKTRNAKSNKKGEFKLAGLRPGVYTVNVSKEGFVTSENTGILVREGADSDIRISLNTATKTESIPIQGGWMYLQTANNWRIESLQPWSQVINRIHLLSEFIS